MLLSDLIDSTTKVITEDIEGTDPAMFIVGTFAQAGIRNGNGRTYPKHIMESQLKAFTKSHIERKRALGELGHPSTPSLNLERVSHLVLEAKWKNSTDIQGKAKLLDTPMGTIARNLVVNEGILLGISTRATGSVSSSGIVQSDFLLNAFDIVADPSAPTALVQAVSESKDYIAAAIGEQKTEAIKYSLNHSKNLNSIEAKVWAEVMGNS